MGQVSVALVTWTARASWKASKTEVELFQQCSLIQSAPVFSCLECCKDVTVAEVSLWNVRILTTQSSLIAGEVIHWHSIAIKVKMSLLE